jgi:hypothetical protein
VFVALLQSSYSEQENVCGVVPTWYPAQSGTPAKNRANNVAAHHASFLISMRRTVFDAVRLIVAELVRRQFWALIKPLKKMTYKQLVMDHPSSKLRHFRTFSSPAASHHSS